MIPQLPVEVWNLITDFLDSDSLCQVCQRLRAVLGIGRYLKVKCGADKIAQRVTVCIGNIRSLRLRGHLLKSTGAWALAALKEAPSLHAVTLDLENSAVRDSGA